MDEVGIAGSATACVCVVVVVVDCFVLVDRWFGSASLSCVRRVRDDLSQNVGCRRDVSEPYTTGCNVLVDVKAEAGSRSSRLTPPRSIDSRLRLEEASDDTGIIVLDGCGID
jgi:hypothetical protein